MAKKNYSYPFYFHFSSKKESAIHEQRWRIELIPSQKAFKVRPAYFVAQIFLTMHTRHIVNNLLFIEVLSDINSSSWDFGCRFVDPS